MKKDLTNTERLIFERTINLLKLPDLTRDQIYEVLDNIYDLAFSKGQCSGIDEAMKVLKK